MGKCNIINCSETSVVYDIEFGFIIQQIDSFNCMNIKGQGHSLTFVQDPSDSTFLSFVWSENPLGRLKPHFIWSVHGM